MLSVIKTFGHIGVTNLNLTWNIATSVINIVGALKSIINIMIWPILGSNVGFAHYVENRMFPNRCYTSMLQARMVVPCCLKKK